MSLVRYALGVFTALAALGVSSQASASACGIWQMNSTGRDLVFGEAADSSGTGLGYLAICEQPSGGGPLSSQTFYAMTSCTSSSPSTDWLEVYGGAGADRIGPLTAATGTIPCGTGGDKIKPFNWSLALAAAGGGNGDWIFGTANPDTLVSNTFSQNSLGDSHLDILCGYGGNDWLIGDSDNTNGGAEECIDGGGGTGDVCEGGGAGDNSLGDLSAACEVTAGGFRSSTANCFCSGYGYESFWVSP